MPDGRCRAVLERGTSPNVPALAMQCLGLRVADSPWLLRSDTALVLNELRKIARSASRETILGRNSRGIETGPLSQ
jgi:hypothetical protein